MPYEEIKHACLLSEKLKLPVIVYVDCRLLENDFHYSSENLLHIERPFKRVPLYNIACPFLSKFQRDILKAKLAGKNFNDLTKSEISNIEEILPEKLLLMYKKYKPFFEVFTKFEKDFVSGDTGTSTLFGFSPFNSIDTCSYMGGSPGMCAGAILAGAKKSWSITGDFSFFAAGILGFNEALTKKIPIKMVIFANHIAAATGGQIVPKELLENFKAANQRYIKVLSISDSAEFLEGTLKEMNDSRGIEVLIVEVA